MVVSIVQTITSIQDNVLAFIPRAAAIFVVFAVSFPWMLRIVTGFARALFLTAAGTRAMTDFASFAGFGLLLVRPGMIVMATPFLGALNAPVQVRIGVTVLLAVLLASSSGVSADVPVTGLDRHHPARNRHRPGDRARDSCAALVGGVRRALHRVSDRPVARVARSIRSRACATTCSRSCTATWRRSSA